MRIVVCQVETERFGLFFQLSGELFDMATAAIFNFRRDRVRDWISDRFRLWSWANRWWRGWAHGWANWWANDRWAYRRTNWRTDDWGAHGRTNRWANDWWTYRWTNWRSNDWEANRWANRRSDDRRADRRVYDSRQRRNAATSRSNDVVDEVCVRSDILTSVDGVVDVMEDITPTARLSSCCKCEGGDSGESE